MIAVFYYDGVLDNKLSLQKNLEIREIIAKEGYSKPQIIVLDGYQGWSFNNAWFLKGKSTYSNVVFVTNMPQFLNREELWNKEHKKHFIWFYTMEGWKLVRDLTDKELRAGHNIEKIYRNGGLNLEL